MKRDMDLVRALLFEIENAESELSFNESPIAGYSLGEVAFTVELMYGRGLISYGRVDRSAGGRVVMVGIQGLSWDGFDYLDTIRSDKVWGKAKDAIAKSIGDTSISVIKEVCRTVALTMIKANLQI